MTPHERRKSPMLHSSPNTRRRAIAGVLCSAVLTAVLAGAGLMPALAVTAPVAVDDTFTTTTGTSLIQAAPGVLSNDTDDGGTLTASEASDPPHGMVNLNSDGSFTYVSDANFVGTDTFTYTVGDGVDGTDIGLVTVTVSAAAAVLIKD